MTAILGSPAEPAEPAARAGNETFARTLIRWHARHGRHDLPWQREPSAYRVWVSEIMLQQTQVATVIGYYERFLERFPDVAALAAAPVDELLHAWSGLGYYSRARNLQRAAQRLLAEHGGTLPEDPAQLERLPGIGRSTAAAIAALAYGRRAAICDGNVKRVLARCFGIEGRLGERATEQALWAQAEACLPRERVEVYTQAIMDFGATLCTRARPLCLYCPLNDQCVAYRSGRVAQLPGPRRRAARAQRAAVLLLLVRPDGSVLLQRQPARGVWAQLWAPPQFASRAAAERFPAEHFPAECHGGCEGTRMRRVTVLPEVQHAFTHFDLTLSPLRMDLTDCGEAVREARRASLPAGPVAMDEAEWLWYNPRDPARIGLPAPIATLLAALPVPPAERPIEDLT